MLKHPARLTSLVDELYARHWDDLCRYVASRFGKGPPDPQDVAQQTFMQVAARSDLAVLTEPRAYLYRTAHNIVIDERRRIAHHARALAARPQLTPDESDYLDPSRVLSGKERLSIIERVVRGMSGAQRTSFLLCRVHGLSAADVARRTGYSESGVRKHISLALADIEAALEEAS